MNKEKKYTLSEVINICIQENGIEILKQPKRMYAYFSDLVIGEDEEKKLLKTLLDDNTIVTMLVEMYKRKNYIESDIFCENIWKLVKKNLFFDDEHAKKVLKIVLEGMGIPYEKSFFIENSINTKLYHDKESNSLNTYSEQQHSKKVDENSINLQVEKTVNKYRSKNKISLKKVILFLAICIVVTRIIFTVKDRIVGQSNLLNPKTTETEEAEFPVLSQIAGEDYDVEIMKPEEVDYDNVTNLNGYARFRDVYDKVYACPVRLYTSEMSQEDSGMPEDGDAYVGYCGNDGSSFAYGVYDLIETVPDFSPQWTTQDILDLVAQFANGGIENVEVINFSTTEKSFYVKGTDANNSNMIVYLMVKFGNTMYRTLKIKFPQYTNYEDEVKKEYYAECIYRLSDFMEANEEARTYSDFYQDYKYN